MHILYLHQHFALPSGNTGTRSYEFARRWVEAGHEVTIITGHYDIGGLPFGKGLIQRREVEGIQILMTGARYGNRMPFWRRIFSFVSFMILAVVAGMRVKKVDVIYATSTPLTIGIPAMLLHYLKRVPFVFEVRDQWPEIPVELGIIRNRLLIRVLLRLEKVIYRRCVSIVALSPGQAEGIRTVAPKGKKIAVVPNACDVESFRPDVDGSAIRESRGWRGKIVFLHAGAMGKVNSLEFLIDAAKKLQQRGDIHFVLIGEGNQKTALKDRVSAEGLANIEISDSVAKRDLPLYFAASDVGLVIIGKYPILEHNSANKYFDSLSSGRPVLLNYSGWQSEVLEKNSAGMGGALYDLEEFADNVARLSGDKTLREQMGRNARRLAVEVFNRDKLAQEVLDVLLEAKQDER